MPLEYARKPASSASSIERGDSSARTVLVSRNSTRWFHLERGDGQRDCNVAATPGTSVRHHVHSDMEMQGPHGDAHGTDDVVLSRAHRRGEPGRRGSAPLAINP